MSNAEVRAMRVFYAKRYRIWHRSVRAHRRFFNRRFIEQLMRCKDEPARRLLLGVSK